MDEFTKFGIFRRKSSLMWPQNVWLMSQVQSSQIQVSERVKQQQQRQLKLLQLQFCLHRLHLHHLPSQQLALPQAKEQVSNFYEFLDYGSAETINQKTLNTVILLNKNSYPTSMNIKKSENA